LTSAHLRSRHQGRALTFLDVLTIGREELEEITAKYPARQKALRWAVIRLATRRAIVLQAKLERQRNPNRAASAELVALGPGLLASATPTFDRLLNQCTIAKNEMEVAVTDLQQDGYLHLQSSGMSRRDNPATASSSHSILSSTGESLPVPTDLGTAMETVCATVDGLGVENAKVQQAIQRLGSEGQAHGAALLRVSQEVQSLREAIERLTHAVGGDSGPSDRYALSRSGSERSIGATGGTSTTRLGLGRVASVTRFAARRSREGSSKSLQLGGAASSGNGDVCAGGSEKVSDAI